MNQAQHVWSTQDLNTAASFAALGFPVRVTDTVHEHTGKSLVQFSFQNASVHAPHLRLLDLRKQHRSGTLAQTTPLHPLLVGLHAVHNLARVLDFQKTGLPHRLESQPGGFFRYVPGAAGHAATVPMEQRWRTNSIALAAALGVLGYPILMIEGEHTARRYVLPESPVARTDLSGAELGSVLAQPDPEAAPPPRGQLPCLLIERTQPAHALVAAWSALNCRLMLKNALDGTTRRLVLEPWHQGRRLSPRSALITEDASDRVLARAERHFLRGS